IGMGKDRCTGGNKRGVSVSVVEMPVGVDQPSWRLPKRGSESAFDLRETGAKSAIDDRAAQRSLDPCYVPAGSIEHEDAARSGRVAVIRNGPIVKEVIGRADRLRVCYGSWSCNNAVRVLGGTEGQFVRMPHAVVQ